MAYSQSVLDDIIVCIQGGQTDYAIAKLQNLKENIWNHQCLEDRLVESNCNESQICRRGMRAPACSACRS